MEHDERELLLGGVDGADAIDGLADQAEAVG